jgi:hypothetical protein
MNNAFNVDDLIYATGSYLLAKKKEQKFLKSNMHQFLYLRGLFLKY